MLKTTEDGMTKVWKVEKACEPFYNGGKLSLTKDEEKLFTIFEENLSILKSQNNTSRMLFSEDIDDEINCFCIHPNGDEVVVATKKALLKHFTVADKDCRRTIRAHQMPILSMCYDSTGTLVATGSADRTVRVWDIEKGYCTHSFKEHTDIVNMVYFHPDPKRLQLFSTGEDNTIRMYSLTSQCPPLAFRDHVSLVTQLALSNDGNMLISAGRDKVLNFYDLTSGNHLKTVPIMEELEGVLALNCEHSSQLLTAAGVVDKPAQSQFVVVCAGEGGAIRFFCVSYKGKNASSFAIAPLLEFNVKNVPVGFSAQSTSFTASLSAVSALAYMPIKKQILAATKDYNICFYGIDDIVQLLSKSKKVKLSHFRADSTCTMTLKPQKLLIGSHGDILDMSLLPTQNEREFPGGYNVALVTNSTQVRILDESFSCRILEGHTDIVLSVESSPDGTWLVTSSKDRRCLLWHVPSGECVASGEGHTDSVGSVTMSQSKASYTSRNVFAVSGGADRILKRWALPLHSLLPQIEGAVVTRSSLVSLKSSHSVRAHDKDINSVSSSPNDQLIASGSQDKTIRLWSSSDLAAVATLKGHKRGVWKVSFSPVDKVLVSCSGDRTLRLWSVVDFSSLRIFEGHTASVLSVKFVNGGTQLMSCSADGLVRLWTVRSGECVNTFDEHQDKVWALEYKAAVVAETEGSSENAVGASESGLIAPAVAFSAGSDSRLLVWRDHTEAEEEERVAKLEETLLLEQRLQLDMKNRKYGAALNTALQLGHSLKVMTILTGVLEDEKEVGAPVEQKPANNGIENVALPADASFKLDKYLSPMDEEQINKLVAYVSEWNTNSRYGFVSQMLISSLLRVVRVEKLQTSRSVLEKCAGLLAYSERHFSRIDRLYQATYMIDYITSLISLRPEEEVGPDAKAAATSTVRTEENSIAGTKRKGGAPIVVSDVHSDDEDDEQAGPIMFFKSALGHSIAADSDSDDDLAVTPSKKVDKKQKKESSVIDSSTKKKKHQQQQQQKGRPS